MRLRLSQRPPKDAYVVHSQVTASLGHPVPAVGDRVVHGVTYQSRYGGIGLVIHERPTDVSPYGPGSRVFRVGEIAGLRRGGFTPPDFPHHGLCQAYTVAEELPLAMAFGPQGVQVVKLLESFEQMDQAAIISVGEVALGRLTTRRATPDQTVREAGLASALHDATGRIQRHFVHVAIYADRPIGPDGILDEFWGCDRYLDLVDPLWIAARQAIQNRVIGTLFAP
jgi:hypothetical protein